MPSGNMAVDRDGITWPRVAGVIAATLGTVLVALGLTQTTITAFHLLAAGAVLAVLWADTLWFVPRWLIGSVVACGGVAMSGLGSNIALFLVVCGCGEAATTGSTADALVTLAATEAALLLRSKGDAHLVSDYLSWMIGAGVSTAFGVGLRAQLRANAQLRAAHRTIAEQAAGDERRRLAREIHDVIAHSMTVTMLHVTAARLSLSDDPPSVDDAVSALLEAETQGRRSLADIRQTVGLLATADPEDSQLAAPLPGAADIPPLIGSFAEAGLEVTSTIKGDLGRISPTTGLAAYRVVQEALANAAKHAPGAPVDVCIHVHRHKVGVHITNGAAAGAALEVAGGGRGVRGMTDRVGQLGGQLRAGPDSSGWQVKADLPLDPDSCAPIAPPQ